MPCAVCGTQECKDMDKAGRASLTKVSQRLASKLEEMEALSSAFQTVSDAVPLQYGSLCTMQYSSSSK